MAVKSVKKTATKKEAVAPVEENVSVDVETPAVEEKVEETPVEETPVEVVTEAVEEVNPANIPEEKNVKVRIKDDCNFYFGGERYSFKKDQLTTVPKEVKLHLAGQDLLSAL